ncbi:MAG: zf-TFIIB domain-containing protein [Chloroflexi bacterium]|nr:zf-TFIIB domain-containing protein [Chloroflexota bacterium]
MNCPKCNSSMEKVEHGSVEVDRCTHCAGIWFDQGEKDKLKKAKGAQQIDTGDSDKGAEYDQVEKIDCPVCHTQMTRMVDLKQSHIWYENCPVCYGVFLDAGEFKDYKKETVLDFFKGLVAQERG